MVALRMSSSSGPAAALGAVANSSSTLNADSFVTRPASPLKKLPRGFRKANAMAIAANGQASALVNPSQGLGGNAGVIGGLAGWIAVLSKPARTLKIRDASEEKQSVYLD